MDNKTIAILTLPLHYNYGGTLQAYALQKVVKQNGFTPLSIKLEYKAWCPTIASKIRYALLYTICKCTGKPLSLLTLAERKYIGKYTLSFVTKYINETQASYKASDFSSTIQQRGIKRFVVGSDQVWRPEYVGDIKNYFFDFIPSIEDSAIISYAASFGGDTYKVSPDDVKRCKQLAKRFKAISVRESNAVSMCKNLFDVNATQVLDPTLLLEKEDYLELLSDSQKNKDTLDKGWLFNYVLDNTDTMKEALINVCSKLNCEVHTCMPKKEASPTLIKAKDEECIFPPIEEWIANFHKADYVLTDSFHGCAFSIIFNKPFWVIGNIERGYARFVSLLSLLGLENRLISKEDTMTIDLRQPIDWNSVNKKIKENREFSLKFLKDNIFS